MTDAASFIDSHCHVDASDFDDDRDEMLARARAAGVSELIVVGAADSLDHARSTVAFAESRADLHATVGIHPHGAGKIEDSWWPELEALARRPDVVGVGETGLDFYYDSSTPDDQHRAFERHIDLAIATGKVLICHIRDAHPEATALLEARAAGRVETIIHCFTGTPANARKYAELGFYISFSGIVSFKGKSAEPVREAIAEVPLDRLLVETDCPYLAPVPHRGKRNEPAFLVDTARVVAERRGLSLEDLGRLTTENTRRAFTLTSPPMPRI